MVLKKSWSKFRISYLFFFRYFWMVSKKVYAYVLKKNKLDEPTGVVWNNQIILSAADRLGINTKKLARGFLELSYNGRISYCRDSDFEFENLIAAQICGDKLLTSNLLSQNGISVPESDSFSLRDYSSAVDFFIRLPKPVVVKPRVGSFGGAGVTTGILSLSDFEKAFALALVYGRHVVVERFATGQNYRILLLDDKVLSVVKRNPAHVIGDGVSTIRQMIEKNDAELPVTSDKVFDYDCKLYLRNNQVNLEDIPECEEIVFLKQVCNYHGWPNQIQEVTNDVHPDYKQLAIKINGVIRAKLCGIDIITTDISKPISEVDYVINEVNIGVALYIAKEPIASDKFPDEVGIKILKYLFAI